MSSDPLASIRALIEQWEHQIQTLIARINAQPQTEYAQRLDAKIGGIDSCIRGLSAVLASVPPPQEEAEAFLHEYDRCASGVGILSARDYFKGSIELLLSLNKSAAGISHRSFVVDQPGRPVAAPCAISGCQYREFEAHTHDRNHPEEQLALRILQEQKDLEAHARDTTDVDRLAQIRDSLLKEPQP
jgi:hypothetical protein